MIRNEKGFSFIELMVVVIILGILAGMIVPRYMGRTDEAKTHGPSRLNSASARGHGTVLETTMATMETTVTGLCSE